MLISGPPSGYASGGDSVARLLMEPDFMDADNRGQNESDIDSVVSAYRRVDGPVGAYRPAGRTTVTIPADTDSPQGTVLRLDERLAAAEAALKRMGQLEGAVSEAYGAIGQLRQVLQAVAGQVQALGGAVDSISKNLQATPVYGLRHSFTCRSCRSTGVVTVRVRCTRCGQESWWGWYPQAETPGKQGGVPAANSTK